MTNKELLELAAKAAGITSINEWYDDVGGIAVGIKSGNVVFWNPLTDDGDALRLAVKLSIQNGQDTTRNKAWAGLLGETIMHMENYNGCPYAATRRAIVRAAAEIEKEMK